MTLLLVDGCEDVSSWTVGPSGAPTIQAGRTFNCFKTPVSASAPMLSMAIPTADQTDTITFGIAFNVSFYSTGFTILGFYSDNAATQHTHIVLRSDGLLVVLRGGTTIATASHAALAVNTWYYIEGTVKLHDTAGTAALWLNGAQVLNATGLDTKNAGTKTVYDTVTLHPAPQSSVELYDDIYITNDTTRFGDCKVETLYPNGNGATNAWTGSDGDSTNNYLLVDEVGVPDTADYVASATAGQQDLYTMTDLAAGLGSVRAVCHVAHTVKTDSGSRQVKLLNRGVGATTSSPARDLSTLFINQHWGLTTNPDTGSPFTRAEVNALQSGVECV